MQYSSLSVFVCGLQDKIMFLCGAACAEEFRMLHCSLSRCEYCKLLKVPADVKRIGSKNCSFCSEGVCVCV